MNLKVGHTVVFHPKVFEGPYVPYYDAYKGHKFIIVDFHYGDHIELKCLTDETVKVAGYVHDDELIRVWDVNESNIVDTYEYYDRPLVFTTMIQGELFLAIIMDMTKECDIYIFWPLTDELHEELKTNKRNLLSLYDETMFKVTVDDNSDLFFFPITKEELDPTYFVSPDAYLGEPWW